MSEQVSGYRCSRCGAVFDDAQALSNHLHMHEEVEPEAGSHLHAGHDEEMTRPKGRVSLAYLHADGEFKSARLPIFGVFAVFLVISGIAAALRISLFVPIFIGVLIAMLAGAGFLFKYLMEG
jgi:hypothetical protein